MIHFLSNPPHIENIAEDIAQTSEVFFLELT